jgi:hypothetical protein
MEKFSLEDDYSIVRFHLSEPNGLMDQAEKGRPIDEKLINVLSNAIDSIKREWVKVSVVPKHVVQLFFPIFGRLEEYIRRYPQREAELRRLYFLFAQWVDTLFAEEPLSEEAAIAIVSQQIGGLRPLALDLRLGQGIDEASLDLFLTALDTLNITWKSKEYVSKIAVGAMVNANEVFLTLKSSCSYEEQQRLKEIERKIAQCLD